MRFLVLFLLLISSVSCFAQESVIGYVTANGKNDALLGEEPNDKLLRYLVNRHDLEKVNLIVKELRDYQTKANDGLAADIQLINLEIKKYLLQFDLPATEAKKYMRKFRIDAANGKLVLNFFDLAAENYVALKISNGEVEGEGIIYPTKNKELNSENASLVLWELKLDMLTDYLNKAKKLIQEDIQIAILRGIFKDLDVERYSITASDNREAGKEIEQDSIQLLKFKPVIRE